MGRCQEIGFTRPRLVLKGGVGVHVYVGTCDDHVIILLHRRHYNDACLVNIHILGLVTSDPKVREG